MRDVLLPRDPMDFDLWPGNRGFCVPVYLTHAHTHSLARFTHAISRLNITVPVHWRLGSRCHRDLGRVPHVSVWPRPSGTIVRHARSCHLEGAAFDVGGAEPRLLLGRQAHAADARQPGGPLVLGIRMALLVHSRERVVQLYR